MTAARTPPLRTNDLVAGPPWILGLRGSPLEAPENTRAGLARALELGLDGVAYDVRASADGELVLARHAALEHATDGAGDVRSRPWKELAELDAGGAFGARFRGERLALLEDALALAGVDEHGPPQHVLLLEAEVDLGRVRDLVRELAPRSTVRVGARDEGVLLEARDLGLVPMLVTERAGPREREFVARERIAAVLAPASAWTELDREAWDCERWLHGVDGAEELLAAARAPFFGVLTNEPLRALAARSLARLAPDDVGPFPVEAPELELEPEPEPGPRGAWWGSWSPRARVRNPFPFPVRATIGVVPRRGAFDIRGLPVAVELAPGAAHEVAFELTGGARRPGGDPLLFARFRWRAGPGRAAGELLLDARLARVRRAVLDEEPARLVLLRESSTDEPATMIVRRSRRDLLVSIEGIGGVRDARAIVRLGDGITRGARGVRVRLPEGFESDARGVPFSCGFEGVLDGERVLRRFAGGLPDELEGGAPGRLVARGAAGSGARS
ncbi:MAG: glycerophosphodiester phosphodiesterase family protein [Planctomycetota bacterium]